MASENPGNKDKGINSLVMDELIDFVVDKLSSCYRKSEIRAALKEEVGVEMSTPILEKVISRAREEMAKRSGRNKADYISESIGWYESMLRDPEVDVRTKAVIRARLDNIQGIEKQFGSVQSAEDQAAAARDALKAMEDSTSAATSDEAANAESENPPKKGKKTA